MQFKRPRLSAAHPFVNAGAGLVLLFTALACSGQKTEENDTPAAPAADTSSVELPAVWATRALEGEVAAIGISGGVSGLLAIAYEGGPVALYNMEAEPVGETSNFKVAALGSGHATIVDGAGLTLFPGVTERGALKAYIFGDGLVGPAEIDLPIDEARAAAGICSGSGGTAGLFQLAYWTDTNDTELKTGLITEDGGDLSWQPSSSLKSDSPITSCVFEGDTPRILTASADAAHLARDGYDEIITLGETGALAFSTDSSERARYISLRDGITVVAPAEPDAIAAIGQPLSGGYPGGLIVVAGETRDGQHQAVFVDPSVVTLPDQ